jgi:CubicO group peptidase (beta-lactamase class C family)
MDPSVAHSGSIAPFSDIGAGLHPATSRITVRDLLCQHSGLPRHDPI